MGKWIVTTLILSVSLPGQTNFLGGLAEFMAYESSIPCHSSQHCSVNKGLLGYAIDKASSFGLEITDIKQDKSGKDIIVSTKKFGQCQMSPKTMGETAEISFVCENKNLHKNRKNIFALRNENGKLALLNITNSQSLRKEL